ncbi:hypothetical protein [Botrimarina sp.]|uniref:hypothetical protein n=1 Tax=Botrimarina sp. TaxID=2795802 RepID=UPI0032EEB32A
MKLRCVSLLSAVALAPLVVQAEVHLVCFDEPKLPLMEPTAPPSLSDWAPGRPTAFDSSTPSSKAAGVGLGASRSLSGQLPSPASMASSGAFGGGGAGGGPGSFNRPGRPAFDWLGPAGANLDYLDQEQSDSEESESDEAAAGASGLITSIDPPQVQFAPDSEVGPAYFSPGAISSSRSPLSSPLRGASAPEPASLGVWCLFGLLGAGGWRRGVRR